LEELFDKRVVDRVFARLNLSVRIGIIIGTGAFAIAATLLFVAPVPQDPSYHLFADTRRVLGISHFGDVTTNLAFLVIGIWGLGVLLSSRAESAFQPGWKKLPYLVFFVGITGVAGGSAYYHYHPDNETLLWDRLPMTLAFMAFFSAIIADRIHNAAGVFVVMPIFLGLGIISLAYWRTTEALGQGDLRFYGLVQYYPTLAIPLICLLFRAQEGLRGRYLYGLFGWYALAKLLEYFDYEVLRLTQGYLSGHNLKHIAAALASYMVLAFINRAVSR
jgi:hypothetical protein